MTEQPIAQDQPIITATIPPEPQIQAPIPPQSSSKLPLILGVIIGIASLSAIIGAALYFKVVTIAKTNNLPSPTPATITPPNTASPTPNSITTSNFTWYESPKKNSFTHAV